ncbi:hypothetical protein EVAR_53659_1 [Eumeta japonica]|uniref:Uncharacterized protein n=1 Tax=Eumeta variegata TaxID=151549 RepID=A0A4C1YMR8_EUMVA|nr:hypothetical protein EVAR_53659_1 [Eumeta japonica]
MNKNYGSEPRCPSATKYLFMAVPNPNCSATGGTALVLTSLRGYAMFLITANYRVLNSDGPYRIDIGSFITSCPPETSSCSSVRLRCSFENVLLVNAVQLQ